MADAQQHDVVAPALDTYAKWRPRLKRGIGWGLAAATAGKIIGGKPIEGREWKVLGPLAAMSALAGMGDAKLEESVRATPHLRRIADRAFDESAYRTTKDNLETIAMTKNNAAPGVSAFAKTADARAFSPEVVAGAERTSNGILGQLFAHKDEIGHLARKQLGELLPDAKSDSYGRSLRLRPGDGSLESLFAGYQPRAV